MAFHAPFFILRPYHSVNIELKKFCLSLSPGVVIMKKIVLFTLLLSMLGVFSAQANQVQVRPGHGFIPDTGDMEFDQFLIQVNSAAEVKRDTYITELGTAFRIPAQRINRLIHEQRMAPADVLLVLQLANMSGAPLKRILQRYRQFRPKGWRAVFTSFEIYPGSRFFLILRRELPVVILRYAEQQPHESEKKGSAKKKGSKKKGSKRK
jgi:hypothetical protein